MSGDPEQTRLAHEWANRWVGHGRRFNSIRAQAFVALAIVHEPDAVLRIAALIAARNRASRIDTTGT